MAQSLREAPAPAAEPDDEPLDAFLSRAGEHLRAWQNADWAERYRRRMYTVAAREQAVGGDGRFTATVARSLLRLMSPKDEYEVARLYTDGSLQRALAAQFEGDLQLAFAFAPAFLSRPKGGRPPAKRHFGPWVLPLLRLLARGRALRGGWADPLRFGAEARLSRALLADYEARLDELLAGLDAARLPLATQIAALPQSVRGYGHVKEAAAARMRLREAELLHRWNPARYPTPPRAATAGQFRGIAVTAVR